jgi:hypothetical protein
MRKLDPHLTDVCVTAIRLLDQKVSREYLADALRLKFSPIEFDKRSLDDLLGVVDNSYPYAESFSVILGLAFLFLRTDLSMAQIRDLVLPSMKELATMPEWAEAERQIDAGEPQNGNNF